MKRASLPVAESKLRGDISPRDVVAMVACSMLITFLELVKAGHYWESVVWWLDNGSYIEIAHVIRFGGVPSEQHFWGFPAVIALTEATFSTPGLASLVLVSVVSSIIASLLIYRLYGSVVTAAFLVICPEWVRLSVVGGSEPLFLVLLMGSFLAFRSDRALIAFVLASLATTVRPVGAIAICAFVCVLLLQGDWKRLLISMCAAIGIGVAYFALLRAVSGDSLINVKLYATTIWPSGEPFSLPLIRLAKSLVRLHRSQPWSRLIQPLFCIAFIGFGIVGLWKYGRATLQKYTAEFAFAIGYLGFMACYNEVHLAGFLPRFAIPVYPFLLYNARDWLPTKRITLWCLVLFSALIASVDLVGFRTIFGFTLHH